MLLRPTLSLLLLVVAGDAARAQVFRMEQARVPVLDSVADRPGPGRVFILSAAVPGAGQRQLGLDRWAAYLTLEAWSWLRFFDRRAKGLDLEAQYRDLAWDVARRVSAGERRDGDFEYYEALGKYGESGAYDADPDRAGVQPERTESTYNGSVWALAQSIYFPVGADPPDEASPEYGLALEYYRRHAVRPEFAWSWGESRTGQESYRELMHGSDEALRSATRTLGLVVANHLISAVDALVSARLRGLHDAAPPVRIETAMSARGGEATWSAVVRIPWPRR